MELLKLMQALCILGKLSKWSNEMEVFFSVIATSGLGYIVSKLEKLEAKLNRLEDQILIINLSIEKRKSSQLPEKRENI